jgi:hypothetical protein
MATGTLAPMFWWTAVDDNGLIVPGAIMNFYLSGTTTPATVYHDADLSSAWTQPPECDTFGRFLAYFDPAVGNLKLIMTDPDGNQLGPTVDPVTPTNAGAAGGVGSIPFDFGSNSSAVVTATAYASGALYTALHPGTSVWQVDSATLTGTFVLEAVGVQDTSGTLTVALVNLTDGAPDTPIATAAIDSLTGETVQSAAIVFPPGGAVKAYGIKTIVSANSGFLIGARIVRTA